MYQFGRSAILNDMERRIHLIYQFLDSGIMPWMWDYDNYPLGKDDEMYGQFYPEDIAAIQNIQYFESQKQDKGMKLPKKMKK